MLSLIVFWFCCKLCRNFQRSLSLCWLFFCVWYLISCLFRCSKCFINIFCFLIQNKKHKIYNCFSSSTILYVVFFNFYKFYELKIKGAIKVRQTIKIFLFCIFLFECISGVGGKCLRLFSHSCTFRWYLWDDDERKSRKRKQWFSIPLLFNKTQEKNMNPR